MTRTLLLRAAIVAGAVATLVATAAPWVSSG